MAEETALSVPIGEWVLREALITLKRWRHSGLTDITMAVNVSVLQLLRANLPELLAQVTDELHLPANRVELEITERLVMANAEQTNYPPNALRHAGATHHRTSVV